MTLTGDTLKGERLKFLEYQPSRRGFTLLYLQHPGQCLTFSRYLNKSEGKPVSNYTKRASIAEVCSLLQYKTRMRPQFGSVRENIVIPKRLVLCISRDFLYKGQNYNGLLLRQLELPTLFYEDWQIEQLININILTMERGQH